MAGLGGEMDSLVESFGVEVGQRLHIEDRTPDQACHATARTRARTVHEHTARNHTLIHGWLRRCRTSTTTSSKVPVTVMRTAFAHS